jgi:hypothetical protein
VALQKVEAWTKWQVMLRTPCSEPGIVKAKDKRYQLELKKGNGEGVYNVGILKSRDWSLESTSAGVSVHYHCVGYIEARTSSQYLGLIDNYIGS